MAEPALRLLRLLGLLQRRPSWSGGELAERLGIDPRTVRRDIEKLRGLGFEIAAVPGAGGGYRLTGGADVPPLLFEDDEATAVAVVLSVSAMAAVPGIERGALSALSKLDRLLPPRLRTELDALRAAVVPLVSATEAISTQTLIELARSCDAHLLATFRYRAQDGAETDRRVEPHRVVATDRRWYLVAFDLDRDDWRTFRIDRISAVSVRGHTFVPRELVDPARMVAEGITTASYPQRAVVVIDAPADDVAPLIPISAGIVEAVGTQTRVELGYDNLDWIAGYLIGLGLPFEVVEPAELRGHLAALGRQLAGSHRRR